MDEQNALPEDVKAQEDQTVDILTTVRTTGGWFRTTGEITSAHYYMSKNPRSVFAVSLCGTKVVPIDLLKPAIEMQHCLVCGMWADSRKENEREKTLQKRIFTQEQIDKQDTQEITQPKLI